MEELAEAAGVTKPTLYNHFTSKESLYVEVLREAGSRIIKHMEVFAKVAGPQVEGQLRIRNAYAEIFDFFSSDSTTFLLLFGTLARNDPDFVKVMDPIVDEIAQGVASTFEFGGPDINRRMIAHGLTGMAVAALRETYATHGAIPDPGKLADWVGELVWSGLSQYRSD